MRSASPTRLGGTSGATSQISSSPLALALWLTTSNDAMEHLLEHEGTRLDMELAGLDPGKIQNAVDHAHQVLPRLLNFAHVVVLARIEPRLERQVRHADDGVHGRADFVAHVGQKVGLERGGFLRHFLGAAQFLLHACSRSVISTKVPITPPGVPSGRENPAARTGCGASGHRHTA
jgi:hypothetical protein